MSVLSFCVYFHVYTPTLYIRHLTCATLSALTSSRGGRSLISESSAQILKSCRDFSRISRDVPHTHVHGRKGNSWGCAHRRCFIASALLSFRCWHAVVNYSKALAPCANVREKSFEPAGLLKCSEEFESFHIMDWSLIYKELTENIQVFEQ